MESAAAHDFESFRAAARALVLRGVAPTEVSWRDARFAQQDLFAEATPPSLPSRDDANLRVPRRYVELAERAVLMRSADRFTLPYRVLYRLHHGERQLLHDVLDPDVRELSRRSTAVKEDEHRMHAFLRFRPAQVAGGEQLVAWYAPQHFSLRLAAPFFARRFAREAFAILTPDESAFWDRSALRYGPGAPRTALPSGDELEALFRVYYKAVYNPARRNDALFAQHVPARFRRDMPELEGLVLEGKRAVQPVPEAYAQPRPDTSLEEIALGVRACVACELHAHATQAVPGHGPRDAPLCLVGEQPGDEEDLRGQPFVGPAGQVLDRALREAGIERDSVYLTNSVKHFRFQHAGKKRLHMKPQWSQVKACEPWLRAELRQLRPRVVVCLGATAAQTLLGRRFSVTADRGKPHSIGTAKGESATCIATFHPSAVLRADDDAHSAALYSALVEDLRTAHRLGSSAKS
jgi:DNA polymerase